MNARCLLLLGTGPNPDALTRRWPRNVPRTTASSMAQSRSLAGRPGLAASAARAASLTVRRMPMTLDTSTAHLRAPSAWVISPSAICRKIPHFVSALNTRGRRRPEPVLSIAGSSPREDRGTCQC